MNMSRRVQYEVTHLTTSLGLIEKGLGLSVLPRMVPPANAHFIIYIQFMPFRVT
jgi:DNA-binding transcriptional LysR family regulator